MTRIAIVTLTWVVFGVNLATSQDDPIRIKLGKAKAVYEGELKAARVTLVSSLGKKEEAARQAGDKKLVDQIKEERDKFEAEEKIPTVVPNMEFRRKLKAAVKVYEAAYRQAIKDYLVAKRDDDAEAVEKELTEFLKSPIVMAVIDGGGAATRQVWIGNSNDRNINKLEIDKIEKDGTFTGSHYIIFKDGTTKHQVSVKGKIEKDIISYSYTRSDIVIDGGYVPAKFVGKINPAKNRIAMTWELLAGGAKGTIDFELKNSK